MWICFIERMDVCVCVHEGCVCTVQWVRKPTAIREQSVTLQLQMSDSGRSNQSATPLFHSALWSKLWCYSVQYNALFVHPTSTLYNQAGFSAFLCSDGFYNIHSPGTCHNSPDWSRNLKSPGDFYIFVCRILFRTCSDSSLPVATPEAAI